MTDYERLKAGLVDYVRECARMTKRDASKRDASNRELAAIEKKLASLVTELGHSRWGGLQAEFEFWDRPKLQHREVTTPMGDEFSDLGPEAAVDNVDYRTLLRGLQALAEKAAAIRAAPPLTRDPAVTLAAEGLVVLRHNFKRSRPTLYGDGPDVLELADICARAGVPRSPERLRNALSEALKHFDSDPSSVMLRCQFGFPGSVAQMSFHAVSSTYQS